MALSYTNDHGTLIRAAISARKLTPGTPHDPVPVIVGRSLFSVWAATEPRWKEWSEEGLAKHTYQGGFPTSITNGGLYILGIEEGLPPPTAPVWPTVCRWCGGDGLHPFIPRRIRQLFLLAVPLDPNSALRNYPRLAVSVHVKTDHLARYLQLAGDQGIDPLAMYGLEFEDIACPRCEGGGDRTPAALGFDTVLGDGDTVRITETVTLG